MSAALRHHKLHLNNAYPKSQSSSGSSYHHPVEMIRHHHTTTATTTTSNSMDCCYDTNSITGNSEGSCSAEGNGTNSSSSHSATLSTEMNDVTCKNPLHDENDHYSIGTPVKKVRLLCFDSFAWVILSFIISVEPSL